METEIDKQKKNLYNKANSNKEKEEKKRRLAIVHSIR